MVTFQCQGCGGTFKKQKVDNHSWSCSTCFSCLDCGKDFYDGAWSQHTSCVSEAEKYQKTLYRGPKKGSSAKKSSEAKKGSSTPATPAAGDSSAKSKAKSKDKKKKKDKSEPAETTAVHKTPTEPAKKDKKKSKKKKSKDSTTAPDTDTAAPTSNNDGGDSAQAKDKKKKKKKSASKEASAVDEGERGEKRKRADSAVETPLDLPLSSSEPPAKRRRGNGFKWKTSIRTVLEANGGEMSVKALKKAVVAEALAHDVGADKKALKTTFSAKLASGTRYKTEGDVARLT